MATQNRIRFSADGGASWIDVAQPDELGWSFETTYTEDSGRVQSGPAVVGAMFTVEAFSFGYSFLSLASAHAIAALIVKGEPVLMHYPSVYYNGWRNDYFYVGKGQTNWGTIRAQEEMVEDFSFNAVGVNPI